MTQPTTPTDTTPELHTMAVLAKKVLASQTHITPESDALLRVAYAILALALATAGGRDALKP